MKTQLAKPALLGGKPQFESSVPIARPKLPEFSAMAEKFEEIYRTGMLTKGKHGRALEDRAAEYLQVKHVVSVSSCTSGLMLTLKCLGIKGKVLVPSFTFMASLSSMVWAGLEPRFVEVDYQTGNIDVADMAAVCDDEVGAIMGVHVFGNPAPMQALAELADERGIPLLFDAAHAFGSRYRGQPVGGQAGVQVFSMTPTKMVVAGEGGLIATNDSDLAERLCIGREYGNDGNYGSLFAGLNARLSEAHSITAFHSLDLLEDLVAERNRLVGLYRDGLADVPGINFQKIHPEDRSTYKDFSITFEPEQFGLSRDRIADALAAENIQSRKYFYPACHLHEAYKQFADRPLPVTERLSNNVLSLPLYCEEVTAGVVAALRRIQHHAAALA